MQELACIEYESGRGFAIYLLDEVEADPPCDRIGVYLDGEQLMDITFGELADLNKLFALTTTKLFRMFLEGLGEWEKMLDL